MLFAVLLTLFFVSGKLNLCVINYFCKSIKTRVLVNYFVEKNHHFSHVNLLRKLLNKESINIIGTSS